MHIYTHTDNVERSYVNETDVAILVENQKKLSMRQRLTQQKQKLDSLGKLSQTRIEIENMIKAEQLLFSYHKLSLASKNIYFCFTDYSKAFDCVGHSTLCNILKEVGIPDHLTCFLRKLCVGQEATVRTEHGKMGWFQTGKGVCAGYILSPYLFNFYAGYIM